MGHAVIYFPRSLVPPFKANQKSLPFKTTSLSPTAAPIYAKLCTGRRQQKRPACRVIDEEQQLGHGAVHHISSATRSLGLWESIYGTFFNGGSFKSLFRLWGTQPARDGTGSAFIKPCLVQ